MTGEAQNSQPTISQVQVLDVALYDLGEGKEQICLGRMEVNEINLV